MFYLIYEEKTPFTIYNVWKYYGQCEIIFNENLLFAAFTDEPR